MSIDPGPGPAALGLLAQKSPEPAMRALLDVILIVLDLYIYIVIAAAVLSWLVAFNVVNPRNQFVAMVGEFLYRITDPVLRPIRNMMPAMGGIDISPIILFLIIILIQRIIVYYIYPNVF
jgi:YggT family protein